MMNEEEVQKLYDDIAKALKDLGPERDHFKTVYESQLYVLEKVLQK